MNDSGIKKGMVIKMDVLKIVIIVAVVLCILYLWAIKTRSQKRKDWSLFEDRFYAHRGLHDNKTDAPENSLKAFQKAVDHKFGIELDIQLTKDGIPVVFHDFTLDRACNVSGKINEYTYEELQQFSLFESEEKIPTLSEVLKIVKGRVPLIVELKVEKFDISICGIADKMLQAYEGPYCIESFNPLVLSWYRRYHNEVLRGQLAESFRKNGENKGLLYWILENLLMNGFTRPDFIAYNHKHKGNLSRLICRVVFHCKSVAWTVKSETELKECRDDFDLFIFDSFIPKRINQKRKNK